MSEQPHVTLSSVGVVKLKLEESRSSRPGRKRADTAREAKRWVGGPAVGNGKNRRQGGSKVVLLAWRLLATLAGRVFVAVVYYSSWSPRMDVDTSRSTQNRACCSSVLLVA